MPTDLGKLIYKHRYGRGWTQAQLAEKIGTNQTAISVMENSYDDSGARARFHLLLKVFDHPTDLIAWWADDERTNLEKTLNRAHAFKKKIRYRHQDEDEQLRSKLDQLIEQTREVHAELSVLRASLDKKAS